MGGLRGRTFKYFLDFAKYVSDSLGGRVKYWLTINEVNLYVILAYLLGVFPPFRNEHGVHVEGSSKPA
ncbi:MAG: hypothetical protein AT713_03485 [Caldivirga sp. JCHS_4]|nr:MAG: hypothetical protein AT713_03485 [Caldivirga sp. JCHS_4]